jgi:hypothetical protein
MAGNTYADALARVVGRDLGAFYIYTQFAVFKAIRMSREWELDFQACDDNPGIQRQVMDLNERRFPSLVDAVNAIPWSTNAQREEADAVDQAVREFLNAIAARRAGA